MWFHEQLKVVDRFQRKHIGLSKSLSFAESFDKIIRNSENFVRISETLSQLRINNGSMQRIFSSLEWLSTIFPVFPQWVLFTKAASEATVYTARSAFRYFAKMSQHVKEVQRSVVHFYHSRELDSFVAL